MRKEIWTLTLVIISSALTLNFSTFTNPFLILILPGILFAAALTLPKIDFKIQNNLTKIKIGILYPVLWVTISLLFLGFQFISPTLSDKTPYLILGLVSGLGISVLYDWQFGFKNKLISFTTIIILSITAFLISDNIYPFPNEKELNIGKQIAIWQLIVGIGILLNGKRKTHHNTA